MRKADLIDGDCQFVLNLTPKVKIHGIPRYLCVEDIPINVQKKAEIELINEKTFELIQQI